MITEIKQINVDELIPWDKNPRIHDIEKLVASIERFGFRSPLIVNKRDGKYILEAGHGRLTAAKAAGLTSVPCVVVEDDDKTAAAYAIADNRIQEFSKWEDSGLADLLKQFDADTLNVIGYDSKDVDALLKSLESEVSVNQPEEFNVEEKMAAAKEAPTDIKPGEIYQLGNHRLMCGDATGSNTQTLMAGDRAQMIFTDPPYNVDYTGKANTTKIQNDNIDAEAFREFLIKSFTNMFAAADEGCVIYVCHSEKEGVSFRLAFEQAGWQLRQCIIWVKNAFVLGHQDYQWRHEPILYGWKAGKHNFYGGRDKTTVWEVDRNFVNGIHPTIKPLPLITRALIYSSKEKDVVLDLFGGSGSTLIACEKLNRQCRMMELEPHYCQVIIDRWESFTGGKAVRIDCGTKAQTNEGAAGPDLPAN